MAEYGCISIPPFDFAEQFSEFSFHSLLTKPEVILTSIKIRTECMKVLKMNLFNVYISKSSRLEEFEQAQMQASDQVANYLKETWVITLKNSIKNSFKDVGKGWYNMQETNRETYEFSKLKKFLNMIRFVMEDTMRFLVEDSLQKYTNFIQSACASKVRSQCISPMPPAASRPACASPPTASPGGSDLSARILPQCRPLCSSPRFQPSLLLGRLLRGDSPLSSGCRAHALPLFPP